MENNYKNKYIKYKNKYLELRLKINSENKKDFNGGNFFKINEEDLKNIRNTFIEGVEYCGTFNYYNGTLFNVQSDTNRGSSDAGRAMCVYKKYDNFIWHTHPNTSKYYPSREDILKILKHDIIRFSYLFTQYGYWLMNFEGKLPSVEDPALHKFINDTNEKFYHATNSGRTFNKEAIEIYIKDLITGIGGFNIGFFNY